MTLTVVGFVLIVASAVLGVISWSLLLLVDWRATQMGRHLMAYISATTVVLIFASVSAFLRLRGIDDPGLWFQVLRVAVFLPLPILVGQRVYLQLRALRER